MFGLSRRRNCSNEHLPGMYLNKTFDFPGFAVGAVDPSLILPKLDLIKENDVVIGIPSNGVLSNGFSLIRKLLLSKSFKLTDHILEGHHFNLSKLLLAPTKIYVKSLLPLIKLRYFLAIAQITGKGLLENIPRILPQHLGVEIDARKWTMQSILQWIMKMGNVLENEMLRTFNCELGVVCLVKAHHVENTLTMLKNFGEEKASIIGKVIKRCDKTVEIKNFETLLMPHHQKQTQVKKKKSCCTYIWNWKKFTIFDSPNSKC